MVPLKEPYLGTWTLRVRLARMRNPRRTGDWAQIPEARDPNDSINIGQLIITYTLFFLGGGSYYPILIDS